jgi:Pentapeptide repeats (8 copies)
VIEKPLQLARPGDKWSAVVRAQTLSVLQGLEPDRKGILLQFLYESGLIQTGRTVISLVGANLFRANLSGAYLHYASLRGANLKGADLSWAQGITPEELEQQAASLEGAIMPDGSKHP